MLYGTLYDYYLLFCHLLCRPDKFITFSLLSTVDNIEVHKIWIEFSCFSSEITVRQMTTNDASSLYLLINEKQIYLRRYVV
jgi:hypothetical protein